MSPTHSITIDAQDPPLASQPGGRGWAHSPSVTCSYVESTLCVLHSFCSKVSTNLIAHIMKKHGKDQNSPVADELLTKIVKS